MRFVAPNLIESQRLCLRPLAESDLPELMAVNGYEEVTRFLGQLPWNELADAEAWFKRMSAQVAVGSAAEFVIVAKATGGVIGRCGLFEYERIDAQAGLGYVLGRAHWRQGYMREALTALISCAFGELELRRLEARVEAENTASSSLLRCLGFTREGVLRERWITNGKPMDAEVYGLLSREWASP